MADTKISGLTSLTTPAGEDLVVVVDDPGGTPQTKKVTLANLLDNYIEGNIGSLPTSAITSGTFANGRIAETNVTQHQAALTITESQISDLGSYITAVSEDTSPALGGNLNVGANSIISSSNGNITLAPNGTGNVVLGTVTIDGDQTVGAGQDNYVLTYDHASGTVRLEAAQDLSTDVTLAGSGTYLSLSGQEITVDPITESDIVDLGSYIENVVEDTTPQLGGNLDVNTNSIVSTANGNITIAPNGTGNVILGNYTIDADATIGAGQDNYVLTYDDASGTWRPEAAPGAGGGISNVVEDTTPQLGGSLDVNGQKIVSVSNGNIDIEPNGTGNVLLGNFTFDADQTVGAGQDNYVLTYDNSSGTIRLEVTQDVSTDVTLTGTGTYISLAGQQITVDPITESDISDLGAYIENVVEDTTPQLGGALDVNGQKIVSVSNGNIDIEPNGTGNVLLGNFVIDADATIGAGQDNYVLTYDHSTGLWGPEAAPGAGGGISNVVEDTTPQLGGDLDANGNDINMADGVINRPKLEDYSETVNAIGSIGGGTQDIDLTLGNVVTGTVDTSTTTFTFSNPPATGSGGSFTLILTNGGSQTVNWPASVDWAGGSAPTLTASGVDILTFLTTDGGTTWYGFPAGLDMS